MKKNKGIRISDKINRVVSVELPDILREVHNGDSLNWSILSLDSEGDLGEDKSIPVFQQQIQDSEKGFFINWEDLNVLSKKFYQIIDMVLIGCKDKNFLHRYKNDQEMYQNCDVVIDMFDSNYWKVFSKDEDLINRLSAKFKNIEFLESE
jgi:hypothetical protein